MMKAAGNLCPVTLELGGKNPCVVTADARLDYAAKRIASGKFLNAGQTCIAPDYLILDEKIKDRFIQLLSEAIKSFYGQDPQVSPDFCRIINTEKTIRLQSFLKSGTIVAGAGTDPETCYVEPTILTDVDDRSQLMNEEIFGPVIPVLTYKEYTEIYNIVGRFPKPLTVYLFSTDKYLAGEFIKRIQSGSVVVNDTVMQVASHELPFGGLGPSGMGRYHGRKTFETFSNMKSVMVKSNLLDIPLRYPPYSGFKIKALKFLMK
jgi:aldehyde dehydrogenase (NAD+)